MRAAQLRPRSDDIIVGIAELLRRSRAKSWQAGGRVFAFEATGHVWEALAAHLQERGERYAIVNPIAVFRLREARRMDRTKTDLTDAEQIAELARTGMVTNTRPLHGPYLALRKV